MSKAKQKGTSYETEVVRFLQSQGFTVERRAMNGARDRGDITGLPGQIVECKNHQTLQLGAWCTEAEREAATDGHDHWVVVHKRRMKSVAESYVTMPLWLWAEMMAALNG